MYAQKIRFSQRSRCLVLMKRIMDSGDENDSDEAGSLVFGILKNLL